MKNKKYLHEKKKIRKFLRKSGLLKENLVYKKEWLLKYQTAIYNHGFHPAWGEPVYVMFRSYENKWKGEIIPLSLETQGESITLPFKESKIIKILVQLYTEDKGFYLFNF